MIRDLIKVLLVVILLFTILFGNLFILIWKWTACTREGMSFNYCVSRMF